MTTILHKRGKGVPAADAFTSVGEILIDTETGTAYTLNDAGEVVALSGDEVDLSGYVSKSEKNDVAEGQFILNWDHSYDETYPFQGRIGYDGDNDDPNSVGGSFIYAEGVRGKVTIGRDGDVELHGPSEIQGIPDRNDERPWITGFSYVQAKDFLDADGNSIVGGGDSLKFYDEVNFSIGGGYVWKVNSFWSHEEFDTSLEYHPLPTEKHVFGSVEANKIRGFDLGITASDISLKKPESGGPSYLTNAQGPSFFRDAISIETTVFGGINIRGNDAERPPQLPYSPDEKSLQYALTVSHETLGRTVEIDKEGIIRANQFTDMDGNPIGGGGGSAAWTYYPDEYRFVQSGFGGYKRKEFWTLASETLDPDGVNKLDHQLKVNRVEADLIEGPYLAIKASELTLDMNYQDDPSRLIVERGAAFMRSSFVVEETVLGGINITAAEADRPEELPYLGDEKSLQYALTVTHETLGRTVEIDKEGIIRANQFTDMDGNPIGGGGGDNDSIRVEWLGEDGECFISWVSPYSTPTETPNAYRIFNKYEDDKSLTDQAKASLILPRGTAYLQVVNSDVVRAIRLETQADVDGNSSGVHCVVTGTVYGVTNHAVESRVYGGINILGADAERPDELPYSPDEKSVQYALTVTHETMGRTVEIDKEGIIRANQFTDMAGNPVSVSPATMVDAFTTLQTAIADEDTLQGVKSALTNSLGGLIEKFEAMNHE